MSVVSHPIFLVGLGGAIGSNARYWTGVAVRQWLGTVAFPWGTFLVNVLGSFLLGLSVILLAERGTPAGKQWHLLLGTGFCGGFTTFSTFEVETFSLMRTGKFGWALVYVLTSVLAGFLAVWVGILLYEETD